MDNQIEPGISESNVKNPLLDEILEFRENLIKKYDIRCLVFSVLQDQSDQPIVIFDGEQLEYTGLSVAVAKELRSRALAKIDGTN